MKILVFSPYYPPHVGGLESHADEFNKHLSRKGMDITVFTPRIPKDAPAFEIIHNNVKVYRFPSFEIISNYPVPKFWSAVFWKLYRKLFEENYDIVISRTRFFLTSLLALIYAKVKKVRWIHIEHGSDFVRLSSKFKTITARIYDHTFGRMILRNSDLNISISKAVQKFVARFDKRESPIIYRGIDLKEIEKIEPDHKFRERYKDKTIVSWIGRLYKWKGVRNTIKAIKSLPEEIRNELVFVVIGDGEDKEDLEKMTDKSIVFTGSKPREEGISILKVSDIYIHSSDPGGGLSTSLLEAMCCGCGIIATKNEGADEVISNNENGILLENNFPKSMIEKIIELTDSKERACSYGSKAHNNILEKFNWNRSIELYLKIFKNF